jgi:hypothetical protein
MRRTAGRCRLWVLAVSKRRELVLGSDGGLVLSCYALIAAISGRTPMMLITLVML